MKKILSLLLVVCMFCAPLRADSSTLKVDTIYPTNDKMLIVWTETKRNVVLVAVKEDNNTVALNKFFKVGSTYPASYSDATYTEVIVYDNAGEAHRFKDDVNVLISQKAKAKEAQKEAEAKAAAEKRAAESAPGEVMAAVLGITLAVILIVVIASIASMPTSTTATN